MPGYRHSALNDISRIRQDLRDRYQDGFAILKELLQNTDDAGANRPGDEASQLVIVLSDIGLPGSRHPLLKAPGLAVLNNGAFTLSDAISITSLGMSNKAGQGGAAGKFGLGLKSIFHWAEAFLLFVFNFSPRGRDERICLRFAESMGSREANKCRHRDWEEAWEKEQESDIVAFKELAERGLGVKRWFGLWIPLRQPDHLRDSQGKSSPSSTAFRSQTSMIFWPRLEESFGSNTTFASPSPLSEPWQIGRQ
ncbi:hypothetical protein NXS98_07230 [Fontisphaera persica]|uniref:sacsin N-terminal ATP-binding-like domain-containing protein n=1 Tax=Fontisphaera persica TaxID=2974023 RepID=UPI0024BF64BE|nr:hypothetical protein [Fontisphaera persica]WCJ60905.1 hypothetical protein NXS98_07230 [Fontisphaera persica]